MKKGLKITSLIFNFLIFASIVGGTVYALFFAGTGLNAEMEMAWPLAIAALVMIIVVACSFKRKDHQLPGFPIWFKFATTVAVVFSTIYLIVNVTLLNSEAETGYPSLLALVMDPVRIATVTAPFVLSIVSFIFIEKGKFISCKWFFSAVVVPLIYAGVIIALSLFGIVETDIEILQIDTWSTALFHNIIYVVVMMVVLFVLGVLLLAFHNIGIKKKLEALDGDLYFDTKVNKDGQPIEKTEIKINYNKLIHINPVEKGWQLVVSDTGIVETWDSKEEAIKSACHKAAEDNYAIRVHLGKGK